MSIKLELVQNNKRIEFRNSDYDFFGYTDYREDIWTNLNEVNWYVNEKKLLNGEKTYIYTGSTMFGTRKALHQVIMKFWYGDDAVEEASLKNYIVEHHDNDAFNCMIENLSFASEDLNLAKAHTYDKNQPKLIQSVGIKFYKNFHTSEYQITAVFTDPYALALNDTLIQIDKLYLLYDDTFRIVLADANRVVDDLIEYQRINLRILSYKDITWEESKYFITDKDDKVDYSKGMHIVTDDSGESYMVLGQDMKGKAIFNSTPPKKELYSKLNKRKN